MPLQVRVLEWSENRGVSGGGVEWVSGCLCWGCLGALDGGGEGVGEGFAVGCAD